MPQTLLQASPSLAIELESWQNYAPGNIILGRVVRKTPLVSPDVRLTICLRGRAKSKIQIRRNNGNGSSTHYYRGRFNFFQGGPDQTFCQVFKGPVHIPPGGEAQSWPFAITIPTTPSLGALPPGERDPTFPGLSAEQVASQPLPDSFYYKGQGSFSGRIKFWGYVEYYLQAHFSMITEGKNSVVESTLPIRIHRPLTKPPLSEYEFGLKRTRNELTVQSYLLTQDPQAEPLSFKQKMRQSMGSTKVPMMGFTIETCFPTVYQIGNIVPFTIRALPVLGHTSAELREKATAEQVRLVSLKIRLKSHTSVICKSTFSDKEAGDDDSYHFGHGSASLIAQPVLLPVGEDEEARDIGAGLQLVLHETHVSAQGRPLSRFANGIYPTFQTYNIKQTYRVKWDLGLRVGDVDKIHEISGQSEVVVLAPSEPQTENNVPVPVPGAEGKADYMGWVQGMGPGVAPPAYKA